ncbi:MAG: hypothetical protein KQI81_06240 [Deltaproteobacteria bacterium]|nr:hypothetical protein [Deltaproteobacteria bacterium]
MSHALKAALLSGLVFPGLGQIMLKHYKRGIAVAAVTLVLMVLFTVYAVNQALQILDRIVLEGGAIDMKAVSDIAVRSGTASGSIMINLLLMLLVACWLFGFVDAYRMGRRKDLAGPFKLESPADRPSSTDRH